MREAFEQWWDGTGGWYRHDKRSTACLAAWDAWQAATSAQEARVIELEEALAHIVEYWNRDANEQAMHDALWHIIETAEQALSATAREDV